MGKVGFIYIMTNKSFNKENWVKIGYTEKTVEQRRKELSTTELVYPYEVYAYYEVEALDGKKSDRILHDLITSLNPSSRLNPNREFFEIYPHDAYQVLLSMALIHKRVDKIYPQPTESKPKEKVKEKEETSGEIFTVPKINAKMVVEGNNYRLLAGSIAKKCYSNKQYDSLRQQQAAYLEDGTIVEEDDHYKLARDIVFLSPSAAASFVYGNSQNGWEAWRDKNGNKLKQVFNKE